MSAIEFAEEHFVRPGHLPPRAPAHRPSIEHVLRVVSVRTGVAPSAMVSKDRHKSVAFARHVAMHLLKRTLGASYPEIGRALGMRDHTTAMSAVKKIDRMLGEDPALASVLAALAHVLTDPGQVPAIVLNGPWP